ncbi:MAG: ABC transporter permease [Salaquimonas sp.]|nr:ABC transporter permease [Salaquimonas sp.]
MTSAMPGSAPNGQGLALAFKLALRELRGGLSGFYIFLACIALGVGAISGVNSVARSITEGIANEGRAILGGDVAVSMVQQHPPEQAMAFLKKEGSVSETVTMRAMARRADGSDQTLVELKAGDDSYPLYGDLTDAEGPIGLSRAGDDQAWVDPLLLERLSLKKGDTLVVGGQHFTIAGAIAAEPDRLSDGLLVGPRVLITQKGLEKTGLMQPGSLFRANYAVRLDDDSRASVKRFVHTAKHDFTDIGWRVRSRENAAPSLSRNIERFSQFLTLVGLTSLIVGGVGVANSVRGYLDTKRGVIATLKSLGASGGFIFELYMAQILLLALAGIAIGLVLGALMPIAARGALAGLLPVSSAHAVFPGALGLGAAYGILTAFVFAAWPLAIARETQAASLFRSAGFDAHRLPRFSYLAMIAVGLAALAALAIGLSDNRMLALTFIAAMTFAFILLRLVALGVQWLARRAPRPRSTVWAMAIGNIHRPGALTGPVILSLGLGLALIVALTLIDGSLRRQVTDNLPRRAPDFFFLDIPKSQIGEFSDRIEALAPGSTLDAVPMLRGRIVTLKGIRAEDYPVGENGGWVLRGDRGITYAAQKPENATLTEGEWWPADYTGEPLVSFSAEEAGELGLKVGDELTVNVLGRAIHVKIANLRNVEWESLGINFVMVFSPNTFAGAPHTYLATLAIPSPGAKSRDGDTARDGTIMREITKDFPSVASVRVRDALEMINGLIAQLGTAIRAASAIALIASALVLAGALAAGNRARGHDAVVLKTLGATRPALLRTFVYEFALLGFATALFALAAGAIAAWYIVTEIMGFSAIFSPAAALAVVALALAVTVGLGLAGTWRILGQKAAPYLREL